MTGAVQYKGTRVSTMGENVDRIANSVIKTDITVEHGLVWNLTFCE